MESNPRRREQSSRRPSVRGQRNKGGAGVNSSRSLLFGGVILAVVLLLAVLQTSARELSSPPTDYATADNDDDADDEKTVADYLASKGLDAAHIAAIMGNIRQESAFEADYGNGTYYGLFQLADERLANLRKFAASKGSTWKDALTQVQYMWAEISGEGEDFVEPLNAYLAGHATVLEQFNTYTDVDDCTEYFALAYERCIGSTDASPIAKALTNGKYSTLQQLKKRQQYARDYYAALAGEGEGSGGESEGDNS